MRPSSAISSQWSTIFVNIHRISIGLIDVGQKMENVYNLAITSLVQGKVRVYARMTIVDRYLLKLFFKIFLICFVSFTGLFIVIHLFTNIDELSEISDRNGGLPKVLLDFYGPRALDIFNRTAGILVLISAIFSLTMVQRRREMTAIEAAGIPKARLVRPILFAAMLVLGFSVVNREVWIPQVKDRLVRTADNWEDNGTVPMNFHKDHLTGLLIRGEKVFVEESKISNPDVQIPVYLDEEVSTIRGAWGAISEGTSRRPVGLLIQGVTLPDDLLEMDSMTDPNGNVIVYSPKNFDWLKPTQCYIACSLDVNEIAYGKQLADYATLKEMMATLRKPRLWFGHGQQVQVHSRILQPVLDMTIILLGLPLVISKADQNIFTAAGFCLLVVIGVQLTVLGCHSLGAFSIIKPAALAAWLPVMVFFPFAVLSMRRLKS